MRPVYLLVLLLAAILLSGCGGTSAVSGFPDGGLTGGGDNSNNNDTNQGPPSEPGTQLRTVQAGDVYNYTVTGGLTVNGQTVQITGTFSRIVTSETFNGQSVFKITDRLVYKPLGGTDISEIVESYYTQDGSGNLVPVGKRENRYLLAANSSRPAVPGTFGIGTSLAAVVGYQNLPGYDEVSGEDSTAMSIIAKEAVQTSLGNFGAWRSESALTSRINYDAVVERLQLGDFVTEGELLSTDEDVSSTEWWVPRIGTYVKRQLVSTRSADIVVSWDPVERRLTTRTDTRTLAITLVLTGSSVD